MNNVMYVDEVRISKVTLVKLVLKDDSEWYTVLYTPEGSDMGWHNQLLNKHKQEAEDEFNSMLSMFVFDVVERITVVNGTVITEGE